MIWVANCGVTTRRPLAGPASCAPPHHPSQSPCIQGDRNRRRARRAQGSRCARDSDRCRTRQSPRPGSGILHVHTSWLHAPFRYGHGRLRLTTPRTRERNPGPQPGVERPCMDRDDLGTTCSTRRNPDTGPDAHRHAIRWWFEIGRERRRPSTRGRGGRPSAFVRVGSYRFGAGRSSEVR